MDIEKMKLKSWQGWLLFFGAMAAVFVMGILAASITERRAEVVSIYANKKVDIADMESRNEIYNANYPREYETWRQTADTSFKSEFNGSQAVDVLEERPNMVILWAGYSFAKDYSTPRGHMHAVGDVRQTLRTGSPGVNQAGDVQPATCWSCKSPDVPRMMNKLGVSAFYKSAWSEMGPEIVNPIGCADCHDPQTMDLHISRPALIEAFERQGKDISQSTLQEMRSLVCAQCHVEYYFKGEGKYLTFPWDKGMTIEAAEEYYDSYEYTDYIHALSRTPILKAQHPDFELSQMGIHAQRGVACADCHMPYISEGGVKFSDHHIRSPLAEMNRTCQICHRQSEETLRKNVFERQRKCEEVRDQLEEVLTRAHIEAAFAWEKGAAEAQMQPILKLIRQAQWRWDYSVASHGASFHAPQEVVRIMSNGIARAMEARLELARVLAQNGYSEPVPMPDISTKEKAQKYIGLDMEQLHKDKERFMKEVAVKWVEEAKASEGLLTK